MSEDTAACLVCGEHHEGEIDRVNGCPTMRAAQATDARPGSVPPEVYTGYLNARGALLANSPHAAIKGLRRVLSAIAETQGAKPEDGFSDKIAKLRTQGVIGARIHSGLLNQALSEKAEDAQAWALMSIAEHAFYRLYLSKQSSG